MTGWRSVARELAFATNLQANDAGQCIPVSWPSERGPRERRAGTQGPIRGASVSAPCLGALDAGSARASARLSGECGTMECNGSCLPRVPSASRRLLLQRICKRNADPGPNSRSERIGAMPRRSGPRIGARCCALVRRTRNNENNRMQWIGLHGLHPCGETRNNGMEWIVPAERCRRPRAACFCNGSASE